MMKGPAAVFHVDSNSQLASLMIFTVGVAARKKTNTLLNKSLRFICFADTGGLDAYLKAEKLK